MRVVVGVASFLALGCTAVACDDAEPDGSSTSSSSSGTGGSMSSSTATGSTSTGMSMGNIGDPCTSDAECPGGVCFTQHGYGFPLGHCTKPCVDASECAGGADLCLNDFCYKNCASGETCRSAYGCLDLEGDGSVLLCAPDCSSNADCAPPGQCVQDGGNFDGFCSEQEDCADAHDNDHDVLVDCPDPDCAANATCVATVAGACMAPPTAGAAQSGDNTDGTAVFAATCGVPSRPLLTGNGKEDVYEFTAPQAGELHISATPVAGDIALYVRTDCGDATTQIGCSDDEMAAEATEQLDFVVAAGDHHFIYVDAFTAGTEGAYDLNVDFVPAVCNDGKITLPEECDDSNLTPGDGCDATCKVEDAFVCANATPILGSTPTNGSTAMTSNGFQPTNMGTVQDCFAGSGFGNEKVYVYTPTLTGSVEITLASASDQGFYTRSACTDATSEGVCEDGQNGGTNEVAFADVTLGTPVFIIVDAYSGQAENGPFTLTVTPVICGDGVQSGNEECDDHNLMNGDGCNSMCKVEPAFVCANATVITLGATMGNNSMGSAIFEAPADQAKCTAGAGTGRESIYRYTPAASGMLTVALNSIDQDMGVYVRTDCLTEMSQIGCADESFSGMMQMESVTVPVTAGTQVSIFVDGYNAAAGPFTLTLSQ